VNTVPKPFARKLGCFNRHTIERLTSPPLP
jgi:hypothetical protein